MSRGYRPWVGVTALFLGGIVGSGLTTLMLDGGPLWPAMADADTRSKIRVRKEVVTRRLKIVDEAGNTQAVVDHTEGGGSVQLYDRDGKIRASFGVTEDGGGLVLYDGNTKMRALFAALPDGPGITLYDAKGRHRAVLFVPRDGPSLSLYDRKGRARTVVGAETTGTPEDGNVRRRAESSLVLYNTKGQAFWREP